MRTSAVRQAARNTLIGFAVSIAALIAIGIGVAIMEAEGRETTLSAALIGLGLFVAIMGFALSAVLLWAFFVIRRAARGENAIARWTLTPEDLAAFRLGDAQRSAYGPEYHSMYKPPAMSPPGGLEIIFVPDAVMIGDIYFGLSSTGLIRFAALKMTREQPLALEFLIRMTTARGATVQRFVTETTLLRVPIARAEMDQAERMLAHFEKVLSGEVIVNPRFWTFRIRIGLWTAAISGLVAAAGYIWWKTTGNQDEAHILLIAGTLFALGGLILALGAWTQYRHQYRRHK